MSDRDKSIYGPVLYELDLSESIARGLLARYQIVVAELRDESLTPDRLYAQQLGQGQTALVLIQVKTVLT
ncbi:hypothetical protein KBP30_40870 [Streptomyces sp. Go40/10]|uniref:hypothetical protein n=1 Tax=Streptomyces sp. Go40/10 TaxID=2825844 RepID=UPI001E2BA64C|nr:hypothetical protein [Streptomyces sp. Go40/10]UFR07104.1 hypothetical protein KBP30_40870 [Streptomyces sp. Go40/10]